MTSLGEVKGLTTQTSLLTERAPAKVGRPRSCELTFTLAGNPVAKGRPRFSRKMGRPYTDERTERAEQSVLAAYLVAGGSTRQPHDGPVTISIVATFTAAASWPKWKRELAAAGIWPHASRPDADNIIKAVCDGLNGRAYLDDSQITRLEAVKLYGDSPSTTVTLTFHEAPTRAIKAARQAVTA